MNLNSKGFIPKIYVDGGAEPAVPPKKKIYWAYAPDMFRRIDELKGGYIYNWFNSTIEDYFYVVCMILGWTTL